MLLATSLMLGVTACSSSGSGDSNPDDSIDVAPIASDDTDGASPPASLPADTMLDVLRTQRAEYSELLDVVESVPALSTLLADSTRQLTLFAPGNGAYAQEFENLGRLTDEQRADVVRAHILLADVDATAAMSSLGEARTTLGELTVRFSQAADGALQLEVDGGEAVALNAGSARTTSNGTIYEIGRLLPGSIEAPADNEDSSGGDSSGDVTPLMVTPDSATGIIRSTPELSEFSALVTEGFFDLTLADPRNNSFITIAPTNGNLDVGDATTNEYLRAHIINNPALGSVLTADTHSSTLNQLIEVKGTAGALTIGGAALRLIAGPGTPGGAVYLLEGELP